MPRAAFADPADIQMLIFDVDGVLTDGSVFILPDGGEAKRFSVRDGSGIRIWLDLGFHVGIISGRDSPAVNHRMRELGVKHVMQGCSDKAAGLATMTKAAGVDARACAFLGDDVQDIPALSRVGYPMCVGDAHESLKGRCAYITRAQGGHGAAREAIEHLIAAKGLTPTVVQRYDS